MAACLKVKIHTAGIAALCLCLFIVHLLVFEINASIFES